MNAIATGLKRLANVDRSIVKTDDFEDVSNPRRKMLKGIRRDKNTAVDVGSKPQMKGVVCYAGKRNESASNQCEITARTAEVPTNYLIFPPYSGNDGWSENVRSQQQKGETGKSACKNASFVRLVKCKKGREVRNNNKILKKHIEQ